MLRTGITMISLYDYCMEHGREDLLRQWVAHENLPLTPHTVSYGSKKKVWWRCEKGHEWPASTMVRTGNGNGCPVCNGKRVIAGINDLESLFPEIAAQWHREKNGALTQRMVTPYSNRKVWWTCPEGHDFQTVIAYRTQHDTGCPYCTGRMVLRGFNDLETLRPDLAAQWHNERNGELTPDQVTTGSHKRVWWKCACGHEWHALIYSRGRLQTGCPACAGKVKTADFI